jgi:hypothetical protein
MNTNKISPLADKINQHLDERVQKGELSNLDMISIVENVCQYFNLATYSDYGKRKGLSYNGVKSRIETKKVQEIELFGIKFVIDND